MEPKAKKQKAEGNTHHIQPVSLVWLDDSIDISKENIIGQQQLRTLDNNLKTFKNDDECEKFAKRQFRFTRIVLIVSGKLGQKLIPRIHDFPQIISIYVFCLNRQFHEKWAKGFSKVKDVFVQFDELKNRIQMDHFNQNPPTLNEPLITDNEQTKWTYGIDNEYFLSYICMSYLARMKSCSKEKDEFISLCQNAFEGDPERMEILQKFEESDLTNQAVTWFNKDPFFYQILENAFKFANIETMYLCRFYIRDVQKQFEEQKCTSSVQVYRGQLVTDEDFQQLKNSEGKMIAIKSFVFADLDRDTALATIPEQNEFKRVLFAIEANPQIEGVKPFIKTDSFGDHKVLFMLESLFKITDIRDEEDGLTIIKITLCANDNDNQFKNLYNDSDRETDLIGFVQLQCDLSQSLCPLNILDKYIENYVNELSEDHPDRSRCYDTLANVAFAKGDSDSSLNWHEKSLELKKQTLQSNDFSLAESYNNIAFVYLQKQDNTQALKAFEQVLIIWKEIYGADHLRLIICYNNIINIYQLEGKYSEVLSRYNQILTIMLKHYPIDDANFAPVYDNIGKTYVNLNQYYLALGYYNTSLGINLKTLSPIHESIASTYKSLGGIYKCMNNSEQARVHFEKSADIYRQLYSATHESVLEIQELIQNISSASE